MIMKANPWDISASGSPIRRKNSLQRLIRGN